MAVNWTLETKLEFNKMEKVNTCSDGRKLSNDYEKIGVFANPDSPAAKMFNVIGNGKRIDDLTNENTSATSQEKDEIQKINHDVLGGEILQFENSDISSNDSNDKKKEVFHIEKVRNETHKKYTRHDGFLKKMKARAYRFNIETIIKQEEENLSLPSLEVLFKQFRLQFIENAGKKVNLKSLDFSFLKLLKNSYKALKKKIKKLRKKINKGLTGEKTKEKQSELQNLMDDKKEILKLDNNISKNFSKNSHKILKKTFRKIILEYYLQDKKAKENRKNLLEEEDETNSKNYLFMIKNFTVYLKRKIIFEDVGRERKSKSKQRTS